jgi:hypothetical protein
MMGSIEYLRLDSLREILARDDAKLRKLWQLLAPRLVVIHHEKLREFASIQMEKIKLLCKMSELVLYKAGDTVKLQSGGVLFKGSITKISTGAEVGLTAQRNIQKSATMGKITD